MVRGTMDLGGGNAADAAGSTSRGAQEHVVGDCSRQRGLQSARRRGDEGRNLVRLISRSSDPYRGVGSVSSRWRYECRKGGVGSEGGGGGIDPNWGYDDRSRREGFERIANVMSGRGYCCWCAVWRVKLCKKQSQRLWHKRWHQSVIRGLV